MKPALRYGIVAILWMVILAMGLNDGAKEENIGGDITTTSDIEASIIGDAKDDDKASMEEGFDRAKATTDTTVEDEKEEDENNEIATTTDVGGVRNEALHGRGFKESGADYIGVIGYVVISSSEEMTIKKTEDFTNEELWMVPTFERDKQFWNETGILIPHKTEVIVREEFTEHTSYGNYAGYLLVEEMQSGNKYYIDMNNYITKPYWEADNPMNAASNGLCIAEYRQVSDYWPVNHADEKYEISDGTRILVLGNTGMMGRGRPQSSTHQVHALVWYDGKNGRTSTDVYFNKDDLTVVY